MQQKIEIINKAFFEQLNDAVFLVKCCEDIPNGEGTFSRQAIITSILCLESAANCFMYAIPCTKVMKNALDKLSLVDKYEYLYMSIIESKSINRGSPYFQKLSELVKVRNRYVHSKPSIEILPPNETSKPILDGEKSQYLKLPTDPQSWQLKDAKNVVKYVCDFIDHFLIDLCEYPPSYATNFLISTLYSGDESFWLIGENKKDTIKYLRESIGAKVRFFETN
tara:strand:+ start:205 stop:873 length:669 start_codon:yes stop_codon:yes gene_type:complete